MQALRSSSARLMAGVRQMGSANTASSQEAYWARYYPKQTVAPEKTAKQLKKEMLGFLVLGPVGAAFMVYDFIVGLEEEHHHIVPPYPWMRIRRIPGMPWGEDGLFEGHPRVAKVWPPEEGAEGAEDSHH